MLSSYQDRTASGRKSGFGKFVSHDAVEAESDDSGEDVHELSDAAIEAHIEQATRSPSELSLMHLYPIDGAVDRVGAEETAWRCRDATWSMVICGVDANPARAPALRTWGREYFRALHRFNSAGAYVNFMMDDEGPERVQATYGQNDARLAAVKRKYDPKNIFRMNQNIPPTG